MKKELKHKFKIENKKFVKTDEVYYVITPDENKAFMNKDTKKVFIHTKRHEGLPLSIGVEALEKYEEVTLK